MGGVDPQDLLGSDEMGGLLNTEVLALRPPGGGALASVGAEEAKSAVIGGRLALAYLLQRAVDELAPAPLSEGCSSVAPPLAIIRSTFLKDPAPHYALFRYC